MGSASRSSGFSCSSRLLKPRQLVGVAAARVAIARAFQRLAQAGGLDRLEQVVDGAEVERRDGVRGVRGAEDDDRPVGRKQLQRLDARQLRHLDVQQHGVDAARAHALQHRVRVRALAGDRDVGHRGQQPHQPLARDRLVVGDQDAQRLDGFAGHVGDPGGCAAIGSVTSARVVSPTAAIVSIA